MNLDNTKDHYNYQWDSIIRAYGLDGKYEKLVSEELYDVNPAIKEYLLNNKIKDITKIYYDVISNDLENNIGLYYNGSLMIDLNTDPITFIDQDVDNIIKHANIQDNNRILECGCGIGYFFKRLIKKLPNIKYKGIDLSFSQIKNAKLFNPEYTKNFKCCDWNKIQYADNSFDNIIFLETIGYATNIDQLLSECYRVLKPGGTLFSKHPGCINEVFHLPTTLNADMQKLSVAYGYNENSLGMVMNVPFFIRKLEEHNFDVPYGAIVPKRDDSLYVKSHFIQEVHSCFETIKVGDCFITVRYPDGEPIKFWDKVYEINPNHDQNSILSGLGKLHPEVINFLRKTSFIEKHADDEYSLYRMSQKIMSQCVIVTAIKK